MTRTKGTYLALLTILLSPMAANAGLIVNSEGDVFGLNVGGTLFDVVWIFDADPGAGDMSLFDGNQSFASDFMDEVLSAWTVAGFTGISGNYYGVDFDLVYDPFAEGEFILNGSRTTVLHNPWACCSYAGWGSVSVSVPEPGTLALFGIGLLGIGAARRRTKA